MKIIITEPETGASPQRVTLTLDKPTAKALCENLASTGAPCKMVIEPDTQLVAYLQGRGGQVCSVWRQADGIVVAEDHGPARVFNPGRDLNLRVTRGILGEVMLAALGTPADSRDRAHWIERIEQLATAQISTAPGVSDRITAAQLTAVQIAYADGAPDDAYLAGAFLTTPGPGKELEMDWKTALFRNKADAEAWIAKA